MATGPIKQVTNNSGSYYCKMPDGTLIQWGTSGAYASGSSTKNTEVTFPISFLNTEYRVAFTNKLAGTDFENYDTTIFSYQRAYASKMLVHQKTANGSTLLREFDWIAIGRWK